MIQALIIDDEKKSRELLVSILKTYCEGIEIIGQADGVYSGIKAIEKLNPDLVFLDIQMKDGNGFDVLNYFDKLPFTVVLVSAYDQYAIRAFKYGTFDYILKPLEIGEIQTLVRKIHEYRKNGKVSDPAAVYSPRLVIPSAESFDFVDVSKIVHIAATGSYSYIYSSDGHKYTVSKSIGYFESMLERRNFYRVHHSHLVNMSHVMKFIKGRQAVLVMSDGTRIDVAVRKKDDFLSMFIKHNNHKFANF